MASRRVVWAPEALDDLESIYRQVKKRDVVQARALVARLRAVVKKIPEWPMLGRMVPEYQDESLRERIHQSYRLVYRLEGSRIELLHIFHSHQQLPQSPD